MRWYSFMHASFSTKGSLKQVYCQQGIMQHVFSVIPRESQRFLSVRKRKREVLEEEDSDVESIDFDAPVEVGDFHLAEVHVSEGMWCRHSYHK